MGEGTSMPGARLHGLFQWAVMLQYLVLGLWVCAGGPRVLVLKYLSSHTAGHQQGAGPTFTVTLCNKALTGGNLLYKQSHTTANAIRFLVSLIKQQ